MPPDSRADGPCGPKARRTRGPASPGQRTAQPFGGTLNASPPALCAGGIGLPRAFGRHSAGRRTRGASALAGVPRPTPPAAHAGHRSPAGISQAAAHAGHRPSQPPQAFRSLPPHTRGIGPRSPRGPPAGRRHARDIGLPQAFRGPRRPPHARDLGPRRPPQAFRGLPPHAAHTGHRSPAGVPRPTQAAAHAGPPAARARSQPAPAARFSRKPPCGIGSRMVYCT